MNTMADVSPGIKADATKIRNALRLKYGGRAKAIIREEMAVYLQHAGAERPLDFDGGGLSSKSLVLVGLHPIVVDNGGDAADLGVTSARFKRAFLMAVPDGHWGNAAQYSHLADSAFYDFCCHWSSEVKRTLEASRHMKAIVVTLMLGRAPMGQLDHDDWREAYGALVKKGTGLCLTASRIYARESGQWAMVFFLRRYGRTGGSVPQVKERKYEQANRPERKAKRREWEQRPDVKARKRELAQRPEAKAKKREYNHRPEVRARENEQERLRRAAAKQDLVTSHNRSRSEVE
jgi:hypothetical protein